MQATYVSSQESTIKKVQVYSHVKQFERTGLLTKLEDAGIAPSVYHTTFYYYLMENITLPLFFKSAKSISENIKVISERKIKTLRADFVKIGVLIPEGKGYQIKRIEDKTNRAGESDHQDQTSQNTTLNSAHSAPSSCTESTLIGHAVHPSINKSINKFNNEEVLINKFTPSKNSDDDISKKMMEYGLTTFQIKTFFKQYDPDFMADKIKQLEFMLTYYPKKVKGEACYLYNSITQGWKAKEYTDYLEKKQNKNNKPHEYNQMLHQSLKQIEYKRQQEQINDNFNYNSLPECIKQLKNHFDNQFPKVSGY